MTAPSIFPAVFPFIFTSTPTANPTTGARNLRPYQWQIGDVIFGRGTSYPVLATNIQSYNVNNQDFQVPLADEVRMGLDTFQAGPITFTIGVIDNAPMAYIPNTLPDALTAQSSKLLTALQKEWKANEVKQRYGELKPITYCDGYGVVRRIYGRPRKFTYTPKRKGSQYHKVTAEYARADTLSYTDIEYSVSLTNNAAPVSYTRDGGDADAWFRVVLTGPMTNPLIQLGDQQIQLQYTIPSLIEVEVNSYPWSRRIIDSNGLNLRTTLIGNTLYLDQLKLPPDEPIPMSYTATGTSGSSGCVVLWRDTLNVL